MKWKLQRLKGNYKKLRKTIPFVGHRHNKYYDEITNKISIIEDHIDCCLEILVTWTQSVLYRTVLVVWTCYLIERRQNWTQSLTDTVNRNFLLNFIHHTVTLFTEPLVVTFYPGPDCIVNFTSKMTKYQFQYSTYWQSFSFQRQVFRAF